MSPVIRIPDSTYERLRALARPFDDTPASVIDRLLDLHAARANAPTQDEGRPETERFENLTHARLVSATFGGHRASNWNELVDVAHRVAMSRLKDIGVLRSSSMADIVEGRRTDSGYRHVEDLGVSIRYVDANTAWRNTVHLAKKLGVSVEAECEWRHKGRNPGKKASLSWSPVSQRNGTFTGREA